MLARWALAVCGVLVGALLSGCGGSERNVNEPKGLYTVEVTAVHFPVRQAVAKDTYLGMIVRNAGPKTIPNVAVTLDSFSYMSNFANLSSRKRPIWIVNTGPGATATNPPVATEELNPPGGGETAFVNTWALGALGPGQHRLFLWHVTPVKAGLHVVHYTISAGLDGKSIAHLPGGRRPVGALVAHIAPAPPPTHVNPETGEVVRGPVPRSAATESAAP